MEKRIIALTTDPHTVSLADRKCSLFVDPKTGSILVDEGDGEGRMNGVVFSATNGPRFSIRESSGSEAELVLDYVGTQFSLGVSEDDHELRRWVESANALIAAKASRVSGRDRLLLGDDHVVPTAAQTP